MAAMRIMAHPRTAAWMRADINRRGLSAIVFAHGLEVIECDGLPEFIDQGTRLAVKMLGADVDAIPVRINDTGRFVLALGADTVAIDTRTNTIPQPRPFVAGGGLS